MESLAKTVILSGSKDKDAKAILSLKEGGKGEIKFYNMRDLPKSLAVGIRQKCKVSKFPLNVCGGVGEFNTESKVSVNEPLFCAVVDVSNAFCPELVLCSNGDKVEDNRKIETAFVQGAPKNRATLYTEDSQDEIENLIDQNLSDDMSCHYYDSCGKCKYKEAFYAECDGEEHIYPCSGKAPKQESVRDEKCDACNHNDVQVAGKENTESENKVETKVYDKNKELKAKRMESEGEMFFEQIRQQIEILFSKYERDEKLEKLVPNSKWVKVNYEGSDECYELGVICDDNGVEEYVCYGIPSQDSATPPKSLEEYAKYLKLSPTDGLWVACQDAKTGETIKLDFGN